MASDTRENAEGRSLAAVAVVTALTSHSSTGVPSVVFGERCKQEVCAAWMDYGNVSEPRCIMGMEMIGGLVGLEADYGNKQVWNEIPSALQRLVRNKSTLVHDREYFTSEKPLEWMNAVMLVMSLEYQCFHWSVFSC